MGNTLSDDRNDDNDGGIGDDDKCISVVEGKRKGLRSQKNAGLHLIEDSATQQSFTFILISFYASLEVRNSADSSKRLLEQQICDLEAKITRQQMELDSLKEGAMQIESGTCTFKSLI